jgi:pyridoxal phosphate enzyme (YggS family)
MRQLHEEGINDFGENRVEVLLAKQDELKDINVKWHFIGTLQTKKVKKIINNVDYLHSLDTEKLAREINKRRIKPLNCFVQVNISKEESKHGLNVNEVEEFIAFVKTLNKINVIGLMGMASYTSDEQELHKQFAILESLKQTLNAKHNWNITELSMGMSNDYLIAIKHGATFLRLGRVLFEQEVS